MKILKTSVLLFYYNGLPVGKIFFKFLKMCDSAQRGSQTLLPGGQTATKCKIIYFILIILKDFLKHPYFIRVLPYSQNVNLFGWL